ncbi:hypothetical protein DLAC_06420 [Tieghemostelium lacteum]|uniref:B box-type domain-containing protein n=1 Tax=Tieghemostelium lacteum TaxID=361077 RepID=A0A151ZEV6_TIELA|nr:hypothetical protein DLAC_06420 [Tieghemostelium lacteum]|eukprot:KYQ92440.1 hypothetical protein DLAC_06420 [Tieghemostelium lacteum]
MNCTIDNHINTQEIFCKDCKAALCLSCLNLHNKHDTIYIDDFYEEIQENAQSIRSKSTQYCTEIESDKYIQSSHFQKEITKQYEDEISLVDKLFNELHDQLHFKQMDIKRELKSYFDDNIEKHTMFISELDYLKDLNTPIQLDDTDDQQHKIEVITSYINIISNNNNNNENENENDNNNGDKGENIVETSISLEKLYNFALPSAQKLKEKSNADKMVLDNIYTVPKQQSIVFNTYKLKNINYKLLSLDDKDIKITIDKISLIKCREKSVGILQT